MKTYFVILLSFLSGSVFSQNTKAQNDKIIFSSAVKNITVHSTSYGTNERLTVTDTIDFTKAIQPLETDISVFVNPHKTFQTIIGIGGALTDASAETFAKLPNDKKQELIDAYYDKAKGIGYTLARTQINSCDFSSETYSYVEDGDKDLKTFSIDHDKTFRIPFIKQAMKTASNKLVIFASPWSPPAFMKDNNDMLHGGKLLPEYYNAWANYFTKFIKAYEKEGIPVWGVTIQNEPMATQRWESCIYTSEEERDFLKNYLGPIMNKQGLGDKKIIVWDHNRDLINQRASTIFTDSVASKYAWGIGFHWYETWTGSDPLYGNIAKVHEAYPSKNILFTEGCNGSFTPEKYYDWANGERYGRSIINDFNVGTVGWTDWNILLDENGGPNHVGNFCFAPIHADTKTGQLIYTPSYYYIGHFSKFIRPNAKRVSTASSRSQLLSVSFMNEDGTMATIIMNVSDKPITYNFILDSSEAKINILPHAIQTLVY
ncbi:MAG: glycoside hydrolase family 30 protein [Ignavibacteriales bacterium]|nr:glycoside hydrolase family 30 protein [Ignavibacteriales bacterium]